MNSREVHDVECEGDEGEETNRRCSEATSKVKMKIWHHLGMESERLSLKDLKRYKENLRRQPIYSITFSKPAVGARNEPDQRGAVNGASQPEKDAACAGR